MDSVKSGSGMSRLAVAAAMTFTIYLGLFMRNPIIPLYSAALGASLFEVGLITSAFMIVAASLAIPLGVVSDRVGRRRLVLLGSLVSAASSFLLTLANSPITAILINAFAGLGSAAYSPAVTAFVGDISKTEERGRSYGIYTTAMQTAMALGPGVGGVVAELSKSYQYTFIVSSLVVMFGAVIGILFFPRDDAKPRGEVVRVNGGLVSLLSEGSLQASWVATFSISFMWGVSSTFLPIHAEGIGLIVTEIGLLFTVQAVVNALSRLPFGLLYDRIRQHAAMLVTSLILGTLVTAYIPTASSIIILLALMGLYGVSLGTTTMVTNATIAESLPRSSLGVGMGTYYLCFYGGMAAGPFLTGLAMSTYGFQEGFRLAPAVGLATTLVVSILGFRHRR